MTSPCPRCGATRTDSVIHGAMYKLVWTLGYHCVGAPGVACHALYPNIEMNPLTHCNWGRRRQPDPTSRRKEGLKKWSKRTPSRKRIKRNLRRLLEPRMCAAARLAAAPNTTVPGAPPWNESCCAQGWPTARIAGHVSPIPSMWRNRLTHSNWGGGGSRTPLCGGKKDFKNWRRELRAKRYRARNRRRFLEPWMGPLPGLRQHGIPPFSAQHLGTNPVPPTDGPLQEVPEALSLSQEIELSDCMQSLLV